MEALNCRSFDLSVKLSDVRSASQNSPPKRFFQCGIQRMGEELRRAFAEIPGAWDESVVSRPFHGASSSTLLRGEPMDLCR